MGEVTKIAWTDHTFSPWIGCSKVAPECEHCYAQTYGNRFGVEWGPNEERRRTSASNWREPLKWDRAAARDGVRRRVFCASLADVFEDHADVGGWREELFQLIERCTNLDWLLLTKRPENMRRMAPESWRERWPSHVWAGTSAGYQPSADLRIPLLLEVPAAVRFVSCEPLIGTVDLSRWMLPTHWHWDAHYRTPEEAIAAGAKAERHPQYLVSAERRFIDWVIVGGESGPNARPCNVEWIRSIVRQCKAAGVATFVKQMGANYCDAANGIGGRYTKQPDTIPPIRRLIDRAGADPAEWPEDLRIREYPR